MSQLGTQPMSPELLDRGRMAYRWMLRLNLAVFRSLVRRAFTSPNSCITRSSCLRSSRPFRRKRYGTPSPENVHGSGVGGLRVLSRASRALARSREELKGEKRS